MKLAAEEAGVEAAAELQPTRAFASIWRRTKSSKVLRSTFPVDAQQLYINRHRNTQPKIVHCAHIEYTLYYTDVY